MSKLTIDDITEIRAYERERDDFRRHVIALKKRRRITVGPFVTLLFENRDTIRFQIQEMARVERISSDEGIQAELDTYNPLIPEPGQLAATLFIELTDEYAMLEWLPLLVGIETAIELHLGEGDATTVVRCQVDPDHQRQLTRDEVTAAVHYVHFTLTPEQVAQVQGGPVRAVVNHEKYPHETELLPESRAELVADLTGSSSA
jgi:hypothetical protein